MNVPDFHHLLLIRILVLASLAGVLWSSAAWFAMVRSRRAAQALWPVDAREYRWRRRMPRHGRTAG